MRPLRTGAAIAALTAYSLFGALGVRDFVLCLAEDHTAVEAAWGGRCRDVTSYVATDRAHDAVAAEGVRHGAHCLHCVDLPLAISNHDQEPTDGGALLLPPLGQPWGEREDLRLLLQLERRPAGAKLATGPPGSGRQLQTVKMTC